MEIISTRLLFAITLPGAEAFIATFVDLIYYMKDKIGLWSRGGCFEYILENYHTLLTKDDSKELTVILNQKIKDYE